MISRCSYNRDHLNNSNHSFDVFSLCFFIILNKVVRVFRLSEVSFRLTFCDPDDVRLMDERLTELLVPLLPLLSMVTKFRGPPPSSSYLPLWLPLCLLCLLRPLCAVFSLCCVQPCLWCDRQRPRASPIIRINGHCWGQRAVLFNGWRFNKWRLEVNLLPEPLSTHRYCYLFLSAGWIKCSAHILFHWFSKCFYTASPPPINSPLWVVRAVWQPCPDGRAATQLSRHTRGNLGFIVLHKNTNDRRNRTSDPTTGRWRLHLQIHSHPLIKKHNKLNHEMNKHRCFCFHLSTCEFLLFCVTSFSCVSCWKSGHSCTCWQQRHWGNWGSCHLTVGFALTTPQASKY